MIHICHMPNALFSGWHFCSARYFVAVIGELHWNKLNLSTTALIFFYFFCIRVFQLTLNTLIESISVIKQPTTSVVFVDICSVSVIWFIRLTKWLNITNGWLHKFMSSLFCHQFNNTFYRRSSFVCRGMTCHSLDCIKNTFSI